MKKHKYEKMNNVETKIEKRIKRIILNSNDVINKQRLQKITQFKIVIKEKLTCLKINKLKNKYRDKKAIKNAYRAYNNKNNNNNINIHVEIMSIIKIKKK